MFGFQVKPTIFQHSLVAVFQYDFRPDRLPATGKSRMDRGCGHLYQDGAAQRGRDGFLYPMAEKRGRGPAGKRGCAHGVPYNETYRAMAAMMGQMYTALRLCAFSYTEEQMFLLLSILLPRLPSAASTNSTSSAPPSRD